MIALRPAALAGLVVTAFMQAAFADEKAAIPPAWSWPEAAREVTCGAVLADGKVVVGTLSGGVFVVDGNGTTPDWQQVQEKNGLGQDEITALHFDKAGRIWAGHRSAGVSVRTEETWQTYPAGKGPLGGRVWDIVQCPTDEDIWIAHDLGLSRLSSAEGTWNHFTPSRGFPTWQVRCLTFDAQGTLIVGTQHEGLLVAKREGGTYSKFATIKGAKHLTVRPTGEGLPSSLINDVLVDTAGRWFIATDRGLAISEDHGETFTFHRGKDWGVKLDGLARPEFPGRGSEKQSAWLPEDYVTTLAEDRDGRVWLGFMRGGVMALEPGSTTIAHHSLPGPQGDKPAPLFEPSSLVLTRSYLVCREAFCVRAILPRSGQPTLALGLAHGGYLLDNAPIAAAHEAASPNGSVPAPHKDTTVADDALRTELVWAKEQLDLIPAHEPAVVGLPDDWHTQGDWIGPYGRQFGILCAMQSPNSIRVGDFKPRVRYDPMLGPHCKSFVQEENRSKHATYYAYPDSMRYWIWDSFAADRRALKIPPGYVQEWIEKKFPRFETIEGKPAWHRRPSGIVDNAQDYPLAFDGPHLHLALDVPEGVLQVSLYMLNYDGNSGANRVRDHRIRIYHHKARRLGEIGDTARLPLLHETRAVEFFSGVYKRVLVRGPVQLAIEVNRNHTFNTMLSGLFVDTWPGPDGHAEPPSEQSLKYGLTE